MKFVLNAKPFRQLIVCFVFAFIISCSTRSVSPVAENDSTLSSQRKSSTDKKKRPKTRATWDYLRYMARNGENPTIYQLLKHRNKLQPSLKGAAKVATGGCANDPWDTCQPDEIDEGDIASLRVDVPFMLNGHTVYLSLTVQYTVSTGQVLSVGSTVYGDLGNSIWSNYASPVANYANGQMTVVSNMQYTSTVQSSNVFSTNASGSGEVGGSGISVGLQYDHGTQSNVTQTGILYSNFSVNLNSSYGNGIMQLNGSNGPQQNYYIEPN